MVDLESDYTGERNASVVIDALPLSSILPFFHSFSIVVVVVVVAVGEENYIALLKSLRVAFVYDPPR